MSVSSKVAAGVLGVVAGAVATGLAYWLGSEGGDDAQPSRPAPVSRGAQQRLRATIPDAPPSYDEAVSDTLRKRAQKKHGVDSVNHINVCFAGTTGVGKSSLINAFRGLKNNDPGAARASAVEETTVQMKRYDFPTYKSETAHTFSMLKLWDVPGSGTDNFSWANYFYDLDLYVFDFIIIVCSDRITTADIELAKQAYDNEIPFAFVRSRADEAIYRFKMDTAEESDAKAAAEIKQKFKQVCCDKLQSRGINIEPPTYFVSAYAMTDTTGRFFKNDEDKLFRDIVRTVLQRRR